MDVDNFIGRPQNTLGADRGLVEHPVTSASGNRIAGILPVAAILVPLSLLCFIGWVQWQTVWLNAGTDMQRAAQSAAEYGKRSLESYASLASWVNDRVRGMSDVQIRASEASLHVELTKINDKLEQTDVAFVIDGKGYPLVSNILYPVPQETSLADRDYFQDLKADATIDTYVSKTFIGRFDKKLYFSVAQRRTDTGQTEAADGFAGVVLVSVNPNLLADGLRKLLNESGDRMALLRADGHGLSTTGGASAMVGPLPKVDASSPFYTYADRLAKSAIFMSTTTSPGSSSLLAMHLIDGFQVYAVSIRPRSDIVVAWWRQMSTFLFFGTFATIGLFLLSLRVARDQRTLSANNLLLRKDNALTSNRLDRARTFGLVGTFEFEIESGISRRSPEYMAVHGLPAVAIEETHNDWAKRLHPDDRERAEAEVRRILADDCTETEYGQTYRVISPSGETRWIAARGKVTRDDAGRATELLGAHVDVTPLRNTELALAESDARLRMAQDALGIGTWEWMPDQRSVLCSQTMAIMWGFDPHDPVLHLKKILSRVHPEDRAYFRERMNAVATTGSLKSEFRVECPTPDGCRRTIWVSARGTQLQSSEATRPRLTGIAYDITERKRADELMAITAHEVEHRAKNTLALVSGLLRMTKAESAGQLVQVMEGRIAALSSTMGLLSKNKWSGTSIRDIIESGLAPFVTATGSGETIATLTGPTVIIDADSAQPLAMAIHELSTNASKYGALSVPNGRLKVTWASDGPVVKIIWTETGGPRLDGAPKRSGFGSRLVALLFEGQLRGNIVRDWNADGLTCTLTFSVNVTQLAAGAKTGQGDGIMA